jgi:prepilin-type N-terminal cleavage/methylation domain-containing protein
MEKNHLARGFTLIELLVVVAIVAMLSSVILASLGTARVRSRDVKRIATLTQIRNALELYHADNGQYPARNAAQSGSAACGGNANWCSLITDLSPYLKAPIDPSGSQDTYRFQYDADSGDNYQTYGLMIDVEDSSNFSKVNNDGGFYNGLDSTSYEVGDQPSYCAQKYTSSNSNWWGAATTVCVGGN